MDARARRFMRGTARQGAARHGLPVGAGERRGGPAPGIVDGSCDRLCVRAARSTATDYAHDPVIGSAKAVTGGATIYADVPTQSG